MQKNYFENLMMRMNDASAKQTITITSNSKKEAIATKKTIIIQKK